MEKSCPVCGSLFQTRWERVLTCSKSCARKAEWADGRRTRKEWFKGPSGYIWRYVPGHPNASLKAGGGAKIYVLEHRFVMSEMLGRPLLSNERVHHKNGIRDDNRPENLELWTLDHKDPAGVRVSDTAPHCPTCTCFAH